MKTLNGRELSAKNMQNLTTKILDFKEKYLRRPTLAVILVGSDVPSQTYVHMKAKACKAVGIHSIIYEMSEDINEEILLKKIDNMNNDDTIDGILVQLPLPKHLNEEKVIEEIAIHKDVDGFTTHNVGALWANVQEKTRLLPATPYGVLKLLQEYKIDLLGKEVVIIGTSNIVGKPLAGLFVEQGSTVTMCNINTKDISLHTKHADILCVGVGKPQFIKADMVKEGCVVIDIGITKIDGKLYGDVDFDAVSKKASHITPVPGGVGPMTISTLLENTLKASINNQEAPTHP